VKTIFKTITRDTRINSESNCTPIIHARTITKKTQNEPNCKLTAHMPTSHNGPRGTAHESRLNMQNESNFTLTAHKPKSPNGSRAKAHESRLNMRNEPNLHKNSHNCLRNIDLRKYLHTALLVSTNNQQSIITNQLKGPNFTLTAHMPNSPNGPRATGHGSRFMQNEPNLNQRATRDERQATINMQNKPNFTSKESTKHANGANFTLYFPSETHKKRELLLKKCKILLRNNQKNTHFSQTFMQNKPNSETNIDHKAKSRRAGKSNSPSTSERRETRDKRRKNAKRTQFT